MTPDDPVRWMVIFKQDIEPVEVTGFTEEAEAREHYEKLRPNWTEVWLVEVVVGPGPPRMGRYIRPEPV